MLTKKVKGVTIIELVVVMLLTAMVVAMAYAASALFFKEYLIFKGRSEKTAEISLLDRLLYEDFSKSTLLIRNEKGWDCIYAHKSVTYTWEDEYVLRRDSMILDTFHTSVNSYSTSFLNQQSLEGNLMDEAVIEIKEKEDIIQLAYQKKYSASILINYNKINFSK